MHMSYEMLVQELKTVPEEYLDAVLEYVKLLQYKIAALKAQEEKPQKKPIIIGLAEGKYKVPDDPNAGDDIIADMFEDYL